MVLLAVQPFFFWYYWNVIKIYSETTLSTNTEIRRWKIIVVSTLCHTHKISPEVTSCRFISVLLLCIRENRESESFFERSSVRQIQAESEPVSLGSVQCCSRVTLWVSGWIAAVQPSLLDFLLGVQSKPSQNEGNWAFSLTFPFPHYHHSIKKTTNWVL